MAEALKNVKTIAVMDRAESFSSFGGPLFAETRSALYDLATKPNIINYVYGLGGRDVRTNDIEFVFNELLAIKDGKEQGECYRYLGVRE